MRVQPLISVPVAAHVKKFIDAHLGNPVVLDDTRSELIALKVFLSVDMQMNLFFDHEPYRQLPNFVDLKVIRKEYVGIKIGRQNLVQINKYFEKIFEENLHSYIQQHCKVQSHSNGYKHEIERFCVSKGIEIGDDISEDALIKSYYRYRKQLEKHLKVA